MKSALWITTALLCVLTLGLAFQNIQLRDEVVSNRQKKSAPFAGMQFPPLLLEGVNAASVELVPPGKQTGQLVFFFLTSCPYCAESVATIERLSNGDSSGIGGRTLVGVSLSSKQETEKFVEDFSVTFPVGLIDNDLARDIMNVSGVPLFVMLDKTGIVEGSHLGVLSTTDDVDRLASVIVQNGSSRSRP